MLLHYFLQLTAEFTCIVMQQIKSRKYNGELRIDVKAKANAQVK